MCSVPWRRLPLHVLYQHGKQCWLCCISKLCGIDTFPYTLVPAVLVAVMFDLLVEAGQSVAFGKSTCLQCCSALVVTQAKYLV